MKPEETQPEETQPEETQPDTHSPPGDAETTGLAQVALGDSSLDGSTGREIEWTQLNFIILFKKYCIVFCNNSKVVFSKLIQDFLKEHKLWIITIPTYCPWLNAWEKLILNAKTRVRKYESKGKEISQMIIKRWFDSIKLLVFSQWVIKSYWNVLCLLD